MAKPVKKKIIVTGDRKKKTAKTIDKSKGAPVEMLFKRKNFYYVFGGLFLIAVGFILMSGGAMPSPDVWDVNLIYSPRRIILAPVIILAGLVLVLIAIFKK